MSNFSQIKSKTINLFNVVVKNEERREKNEKKTRRLSEKFENKTCTYGHVRSINVYFRVAVKHVCMNWYI